MYLYLSPFCALSSGKAGQHNHRDYPRIQSAKTWVLGLAPVIAGFVTLCGSHSL
jgi:hypothetical protein